MGDKAQRFLERMKRMDELKKRNGMYEVKDDIDREEDPSSSNSLSDGAFSSIMSNYEDSFTVDYDKQAALLWKHGAVEAYCSWCLEKTWHGLDQANSLTRTDYRCNGCRNYTLKCRVSGCEHMATYKPEKVEAKNVADLVRQNWASEFCAEHDGSIAAFDTLNDTLSDLCEFERVYKNKKVNAAGLVKKTGVGVVVTGAIASGAWLAAPWVASTLGSLGLLGAASTGTAISSLSGAALTSASLAALGPGGVAGGVGCITAAGVALGAKKGAAIGAGYFGEIEDFDIIKVRDGTGPALIFINGFLSQQSEDKRRAALDELSTDWLNAIREIYPENPCYIVTWESSTLFELGRLAGSLGTKAFEKIISAGVKGIPKAGGGPLGALLSLTALINNPWHRAMYKAQMTGVLLADIISRTDIEDGVILMGHSLGARVIHYVLEALATRVDKPLVKKAYLLGGAVGNDSKSWRDVSKAVEDNIYNVYSDRDDVLRLAYQSSNAFVSRPIGLGDIARSDPSIVSNFNASELVSGHIQHKEVFGEVLKSINKMSV